VPVADVIAVVALLALLLTAYAHPRGRVEAGVGLAAAAGTLAVAIPTGVLAWADVADTLAHLGPVVLFLITILVVADVCGRAGLFTAAAGWVRDLGRSRTIPIFTGLFLLAAAVTAVLSLDATVVLLTPVVVATAAATGTSYRPGAMACLRMANSASLLLPVSNLTNLLAMPHLDLTFGGFALVMAPVLVAVLLMEYAVLRLAYRHELAAAPDPVAAPPRTPLPRVPLVVVLAMLAGFALVSPWGLDPCWVSTAAAAALVIWGRRRGLLERRDVAQAAHPAFALFVLCLGVVVAALSAGFLGDWVSGWLPDGAGLGFVDLLVIALLATALANALTNLSATLLLVPLVAPLGEAGVLAALLGLNIGSGLSYTGSLANLLWRRGMVRQGHPPSLREFHRTSLVATPLSLLVAVAVLSLVAQ